MKTSVRIVGFLSLGAVAVALSAGSERKDMWAEVEKARSAGLPQTAIGRLDPIIEGALRDGAYAEAARAMGVKIAFEGEIQGNKPEERIIRLEKEIEAAPDELRPILHAIQAHWHWQYFQRNRWRFLRRTATSEAPGNDITTWDLQRLFTEIGRHFDAALLAQDRLRAIPVSEYDVLLEKGALPDRYRPTLYDFIAGQALEFYGSGEQAATSPQDAFVPAADSPIFGSVDEFVRWTPETTDTGSPLFKGLQLFRELALFHRKTGHLEALADWDLARLRFGFNHAAGEDRNTRYQASLNRFVEQHSDREISARARHALATVLRDKGELAQARAMALEGVRRFPDSPGGKLCFNLIREIEEPAAAVFAERVWALAAAPEIRVRYRNVGAVHFRLVAADWEARLREQPAFHPERLHEEEQNALLKADPSYAWSAPLPPTDDFREREETVAPPQNIRPGFYWLIAAHEPTFRNENSIVSCTAVWVSDLALIMRSRWTESAQEGLVLDAVTGEPVAGATVQAWALAGRWHSRGQVREDKLDPLPTATTDENGLFRLEGRSNRSHVLLAARREQSVAATQTWSARSRGRSRTRTQRTVFFTDRAIYRPGQTIRFKGIAIETDTAGDLYRTLSGRTVAVVFHDANGKEVERIELRTNDYGSFSGSVTAPRDRLPGAMMLRARNPNGSAQIRVEEYKRPTFQVGLAAPETAPKLNDAVRLTGTATAYTGAPTDGAEVRWRVVREVRYPDWWFLRCWWLPPAPGPSQEIAHGSARTAVDGTFVIEFPALPDPHADRQGDPSFHFKVHADVTDAAGETRSAHRYVRVGFTALTAALAAESWLEADRAFEMSVRTATLDGEGQAATGSLKIHRLASPARVQRARMASPNWHDPFLSFPAPAFPHRLPETREPDPSNPDTWPLGEAVANVSVQTDAEGRFKQSVTLKAGLYRALLETSDRFGQPVRAERTLRVLDPAANRLALKVPHLFDASSWTVEPGDMFTAYWGSGYEHARALIEIEHRGNIVQRYWSEPGRTQIPVRLKVTEAMRGGFHVHVTQITENRAYLVSKRVDVPWSNKNLTIAWERFTSRLEPGAKDVWTAVISGPDAKTAAAEMVATLYDRSLDAFVPHGWVSGFGVFRQDHSALRSSFENAISPLRHLAGQWPRDRREVAISYRAFPHEILGNLWGLGGQFQRGESIRGMMSAMPAPRAMMADAAMGEVNGDALPSSVAGDIRKRSEPAGVPEPLPPSIDLEQVQARTDFSETAFFFPHLFAGEDGKVRMEFTMPEALTEWAFLGFAHDSDLRAGLLTDSMVTAKELMVQPNPPRFLREGDRIEFVVRVTNRSAARQKGAVRLTFSDARTGDALDAQMGLTRTEQPFDVPAGESRTYAWPLTVPDRPGILVYRAVASTGRLSDGEENWLPLLSRRILVTESLPLPIRGPGEARFEFGKLLRAGESDTLESKTLTLQMVSHPAWYAVMALPWLMEHPQQSSDQIFHRLYANALARHVANADPKIRRVFDLWKNTDALDSPLEKNESLKAVALEETPWLRQAESESQARRNVGILFDANRLNDETARATHELSQMQLTIGAWPWFPNGRPDAYTTLRIVAGFGRLRHLGAQADLAAALRAIPWLDNWMDEQYREIVKNKRQDAPNLTPSLALYLYARSFFLKDAHVPPDRREAYDYFLGQARPHWLTLSHRQSQAHLALALQRNGDREAAGAIVRSLRERAVTDGEMGMFWRDSEHSWWWYRAPIEAQAMMIEAFDEVAGDAEAVEACKVWLLKQKQTQHWRATRATADAVYALLMRGANMLASDALVETTLGNRRIEPDKTEAGTGFYEKRFVGAEIAPELGRITLRKTDDGVAWGSLHWQYLEDIAKVAPHDGTPLRLEKTLHVKRNTPRGPELQPVNGPLAVGDELVSRIVLRTDRDMEYVHLKDERGSGTEPVHALSRHRHQDGLSYYETVRDTASHFYIGYLPKGTYVFETSVRVQHRGRYPSGLARVQCLYAPEFNSHSSSVNLAVE